MPQQFRHLQYDERCQIQALLPVEAYWEALPAFFA